MTHMKIYWLGHAAFKIIMYNGVIIYLDPYNIKEGKEKADIVVSSHNHGDHFSKKDIKEIVNDDTLIIGPVSCESSLKAFKYKALNIGDSYDRKDLSIQLVPAYTIKKGTHPKSNQWAGMIISSGGRSIYHAGDTERIPEMKDLASKNITVAILPMGGTYTMDIDEATEAVLDIKPEIAIPMHNWGKDLNPFKEILAKKDPNIKVVLLKEGGEPLEI
ncbi:MAG: MBL fold metallo-hydrolase [Promethearchaeota archaeon]